MITQIDLTSPSTLELFARVLAKAFHDDPLFKIAFPISRHRMKRLPAFFAQCLRYGIKYGEVYTIQKQGVAIWLPPGKTNITTWRALRSGMAILPFKIGLPAIFRLERASAISDLFHQRYAPEPHWYLFLLGIDPASQRCGLGSLLLQNKLVEIDRAHLPCYLETNHSGAVRLYQKYGFHMVGDYQFRESGLNLWAMHREGR